jgi:hypothetical protein
MEILLKSKAEVERHFGQSATMATNLLDMVAQGEKAYGFLLGGMTAGFDITVGFFNDKARYAAFKRRAGSQWNEGTLRAVLMQIGPYANWTVKPDSDYVDYVEKSGDTIVAIATGWQTPRRGYAFVYVPTVSNEIALMPDKFAVDAKF